MPKTTRRHPLSTLALGLPLIAGLSGAAVAVEPTDEQRRQMREDCHLEAQAAGLKGTALEEFVAQCVADLISVELHNLSKD